MRVAGVLHKRGLFVSMITDKARKVVCLGLNESASQGEWQAAAIAVFQLWRKDGLSDEDLFPPDRPEPEQVGVEIMPFGKFCGWHIHAVPLDYLRWMLANLDNLSPELRNRVTFEVQNRRP